MPIDVSPASYSPGVSLARGSLASDPVIPAGSDGAVSGANGFSFSSLGACAGGGVAGFCSCACTQLVPKHKISAAPATPRATRWTGFIVSPLTFFLQHGLHDPYLGALRIIRVGREIEQLGILSRACGIEQILHHGQRAMVMLNHPGQK